ncbi:hypothetical protein [uncultured Thiodictyon sp.]|uniref:hypothetical protein n=1 Tax=uncultured Thiodictyon sp. TaxID=1846217 RepID=UPI0025F09C8C|nr:hypothetical protein [uncultured Thiodictyon sp.]
MIVLDTHVWLWWINRDQARLKPAWRARIDSAEPVGGSEKFPFYLELAGRLLQ